jgi:ABC-type glycerol-3-phosphate transport system substrate-binding protein
MATRRDFLKYSAGAAASSAFLGGFGTSAFAANKFWFNTLFHGGDAQAMEIIVKKIRESNKDLEIDLTQGAWTEYYAQLYNSVIAGAAPQLGIVDDFRYEAIAPVLYNINDTAAGDIMQLAGLSPKDFLNWDISLVQGKPLGIPLDQNMFGIFYNKAIFKEAGLDPENFPKTAAEFESACEAIKKIGKIPYHPALSGETRFIRRAWFALLWANNGKLFDNNKAAFNTDKGRESLQYLVDMVLKRGWNKPGTNGNNQFLAGELAMVQQGTWFYLTSQKSKVDFGVAIPPKFFDKHVTWGGFHLFVLPKQAGKDKETVAKLEGTAQFLKAFMPHMQTWGELGGAVPLYNAALADPKLKETETWKKSLGAFAKAAADGTMQAEPRHPKITEVDLAIEPFTQQAYNGTMPVAEALNKAEEAVNKVLASS